MYVSESLHLHLLFRRLEEICNSNYTCTPSECAADTADENSKLVRDVGGHKVSCKEGFFIYNEAEDRAVKEVEVRCCLDEDNRKRVWQLKGVSDNLCSEEIKYASSVWRAFAACCDYTFSLMSRCVKGCQDADDCGEDELCSHEVVKTGMCNPTKCKEAPEQDCGSVVDFPPGGLDLKYHRTFKCYDGCAMKPSVEFPHARQDIDLFCTQILHPERGTMAVMRTESGLKVPKCKELGETFNVLM